MGFDFWSVFVWSFRLGFLFFLLFLVGFFGCMLGKGLLVVELERRGVEG